MPHPPPSGRHRYHPRAMRLPPTLPVASPARHAPRTALLINPFYPKDPHASFGKHVLTPTLALTAIAATTPPGWTVALWDENLLQGPPPHHPLPQVVGITVHLTFADRAYALARWYRDQGSLVILGGPHIHACPAEAMPHADIIAMGDGVPLWPRILADIDAGRPLSAYRALYDQPFRDQPEPARGFLPRRHFLTTLSINATRGCHNRCGFCHLSTAGLRMPYQRRDTAQIAATIAASDEPYAVFTDNNLGSDPDYLLDLCRAIAPLRRIWSAAVSLDVSNRPEVVRAMALSGCTGVFIGFESLSDRNLIENRKRSPACADYARRVALFHDHGIQVNGSFVLGFDHDDGSVFARTADWIEAQRLECATFHILTPYPGTPLFARLEAEGRLLHTDWRRYDTAHCVFRPRLMSPEQLEAGYDGIYRRLFSLASIWRRRPQTASAVPAYLAMSVLYKRANPLWHALIRRGLVHAAWRPLIQLSRWRHERLRRRLAGHASCERAAMPVPAGLG